MMTTCPIGVWHSIQFPFLFQEDLHYPKGLIDVEGCEAVASTDEPEKHPFAFTITHPKYRSCDLRDLFVLPLIAFPWLYSQTTSSLSVCKLRERDERVDSNDHRCS